MKESQDPSFKSGEHPIMDASGTYMIGIQAGGTVFINNEYGEWIAHQKTVFFNGKELSGAIYHPDGRIAHDSIERQFVIDGDTSYLNYVWDQLPPVKSWASDSIQPTNMDLTRKVISYTEKPKSPEALAPEYPGNKFVDVATLEFGVVGLGLALYNIYEYCKNIISIMRM